MSLPEWKHKGQVKNYDSNGKFILQMMFINNGFLSDKNIDEFCVNCFIDDENKRYFMMLNQWGSTVSKGNEVVILEGKPLDLDREIEEDTTKFTPFQNMINSLPFIKNNSPTGIMFKKYNNIFYVREMQDFYVYLFAKG